MLHQSRYMDSLHWPPATRSPLCLRYIILALAATTGDVSKDMAMLFYQRARSIAELNEVFVSYLATSSVLDLTIAGPKRRLYIISPRSMLVPYLIF